MCDESRPTQRHPIEYAIDGYGGRWWQSPTIDQGYENHYVTITLDLKQVSSDGRFLSRLCQYTLRIVASRLVPTF